ncbi:hypothetical protein [Spongiactinospora sp. TRM90649]|uniref:hypothetical protein n=1 Tax=Spongiactinospora sp. TRM90649 TaxID=3031114 RepID=UPI0023F63230|nr:hypothetical protein [Spongiactinospora sp. TRM90649]MDF5756558.1 hypothetical protein [Spongiactinospora sp. TRM90649]
MSNLKESARPDLSGLRDAALYWAVISFIESQPGRWSQVDWRIAVLDGKRLAISAVRTEDMARCGTAMCVAGWISDLTGGRWYVELSKDGVLRGGEQCSPELIWSSEMELVVAEEGDAESVIEQKRKVAVVPAQHRATRLLGITKAQAEDLFGGGNDLRYLIERGEAIFGPRPVGSHQ